jgi:hypothetical protein
MFGTLTHGPVGFLIAQSIYLPSIFVPMTKLNKTSQQRIQSRNTELLEANELVIDEKNCRDHKNI